MSEHEARFGRVVLLADDLDALAEAYRRAFGWRNLVDQEGPDGRRYLHVGPSSQPGVGVWFLVPEAEQGAERVGAQTGGEPLLVLYVDALDAVTARASDAGMEALGEAGGDATSRWRHLRDPAGNRIVVVEMAADRGARPGA